MRKPEAKKEIKVCLIAISLGKGGAERSTALLSRMLKRTGFNVHMVILNNVIDYEFEGQLFNLGVLKNNKDSLIKQIDRFRKLRNYLIQENFDLIIDNRNRISPLKEWLYLTYLYRGLDIVYVVRSYKIENYFPPNSWVTKKMVQKAKRIVGVSKSISEEINSRYKTQKAVTIYNPSENSKDLEVEEDCEGRYIIFVGRLVEEVKNLSLLLEAYKKSKLPENNIQLKVMGDGPDLPFLKEKIVALDLQSSVVLLPFRPNVYPIIKNALFLVLTSFYEGFPRVLIEALSVGVPVISVDCKSGPNEIIEHGKNGLLVKNHDADALAEAMNTMVYDNELYGYCKTNAKNSITHLNFETIEKQWKTLITHD